MIIFGKQRFRRFPFSVDGKHTTISRAHPQNQVQGQLWQVHRQRARIPLRQIGEDQALVLCKKNSRDASLFCFEAHSAKHLRNCMIQCDTSCIYLHTQTCRNFFWEQILPNFRPCAMRRGWQWCWGWSGPSHIGTSDLLFSKRFPSRWLPNRQGIDESPISSHIYNIYSHNIY